MSIRMSNEMREILNDLASAREELSQAIKDRDAEKAQAARDKIEKLDSLYDAAEVAFQNERRVKLDPPEEHDSNDGEGEPTNKIKYDAKLFYKALYRPTAQWIMNTDAFLAISELKDGNGRSYIQEDPKVSEQYVLLGSNIYILDDIETEDNKTVIMYGDLDKAYRMFTRREFGIAFTDVGAGAFETDTIKARGIERFDGKIMDNNALVIVRDFAVTTLDVNAPSNDFGVESTEITKESLAYQTKSSLLELADDYGIAGITDTMTKSAIITAILSALTDEGASGGNTDTSGE